MAEMAEKVDLEGLGRPSAGFKIGRVKWFNVAKGWGFLTPVNPETRVLEKEKEVFVHQSVLQMTGFRSLGDEEVVEYKALNSDKGHEATAVRAVGGGDCQGSHRRPGAKKKTKKVRCFNCGDFANHLASKCPQAPMPKRCHNCKGADHLIEDCPTLPPEKKRDKEKEQAAAATAAATTTAAAAATTSATAEATPAVKGAAPAAGTKGASSAAPADSAVASKSNGKS